MTEWGGHETENADIKTRILNITQTVHRDSRESENTIERGAKHNHHVHSRTEGDTEEKSNKQY